MEIATLGGHTIGVCTFCDLLFESTVEDGAVEEVWEFQREHLEQSPECKKKSDNLPKMADLQGSFAESNRARRDRIDSHPDNGKEGYWLVEGVRHDARTKASSAREAIEKCKGEVDDWESPEATFIGEELPEVF